MGGKGIQITMIRFQAVGLYLEWVGNLRQDVGYMYINFNVKK